MADDQEADERRVRFDVGWPESRESYLKGMQDMLGSDPNEKGKLTEEELQRFAEECPTEQDIAAHRQAIAEKYRDLVAGQGQEYRNTDLWQLIQVLKDARREGKLDCGDALWKMAEFSLAALLELASDNPEVAEQVARTLNRSVQKLNDLVDAERDPEYWPELAERFPSWPMNYDTAANSLIPSIECVKTRAERLRVGAADPWNKVESDSEISRLLSQWLRRVQPLIGERKKAWIVGTQGEKPIVEDYGKWPGFGLENVEFYLEKFIGDIMRERNKSPITDWPEFTENSPKDHQRKDLARRALRRIFRTLEEHAAATRRV